MEEAIWTTFKGLQAMDRSESAKMYPIVKTCQQAKKNANSFIQWIQQSDLTVVKFDWLYFAESKNKNETMNDFYITLPSNTLPTNTTVKFSVHLPN